MFDFCRNGGKGVGYDAATNTWGATCGNYNWSAKYGGYDTATGAAKLDAPTCPGGCAQKVICTGNGIGKENGLGIERAVNGCFSAGQEVVVNATQDLALAAGFARNGPGCNVYLPRGNYNVAGCGARLDGSRNECPILPYPDDNHVVHVAEFTGGKTLCGEGADWDGPFEDAARLAGAGAASDDSRPPLMSGTYLLQTGGLSTGEQTPIDASTNTDKNGDNVDLTTIGVVQIGGQPGANICVPISTTNPTCNARSGTPLLNVAAAGGWWGRSFGVIADAVGSELCVDNAIATTGTCRGDRRITCDATGVRTGIGTGGCDFGVGGDLGPCDTFQQAIQYEAKAGNRDDMIAAGASQVDDDDAAVAANINFHYGRLDAEGSSFGSCAAGAGVLVGWGSRGTSQAPPAAAWIYRTTRYTTAIQGARSIVVGRMSDVIQNDDVLSGVTIMTTGYFGREANDPNLDTTSTGLATSGSASTLTSTGAGWSADQFKNLTIVLRPNALSADEGCSSNCRELRGITTNTATQITVATNWTTNPAVNDPFRISRLSCPWVATGSGPDGCDMGHTLRPHGIYGATVRRVAFWYSGTIDTPGSALEGFTIREFLVSEQRTNFTNDSGGVDWKEGTFWNNAPVGVLISPSFGIPGSIDHVRFVNNTGAQISIGGPRGTRVTNSEFIGNNTGGYGSVLIQGNVDNVLLENLRFVGNVRGAITIIPWDTWNFENIVIRNIYTEGPGTAGTGANLDAVFASAPITVINNGGGQNGGIRGLLIENVHVRVDINSANQPCAVWLDGRAGGGIAADMSNITLRNIFMRNLQGGNEAKAVCVGDMAAGFRYAANDVGYGTMASPPIVQNARSLYGTNFRRQPEQIIQTGTTTTLQTEAKTCSAARAGAVVRTTTDTAAGTCAATVGPPQVLNGAGTATSVCKCLNTGAWAAF